MKLEQLQRVWQSHHQRAATSQPSNFSAETITKSVKFETTLWWRDWIETCGAIFVIVMFGSMFFTEDLRVISAVGLMIIIASTICIIWILHSNRKRRSTIPSDHSFWSALV